MYKSRQELIQVMQVPEMLLQRAQRYAEKICRGVPAKVIGTDYLTRWYVIPRNRLFNIYLHHVVGDDPDVNLHDHPWLFNGSLVLQGEILEELQNRHRTLGRGSLTFRLGRSPHRLLLHSPASLTLFITGPKVRRWGFYTDRGWIDSRRYLRGDGDGRAVNVQFQASDDGPPAVDRMTGGELGCKGRM